MKQFPAMYVVLTTVNGIECLQIAGIRDVTYDIADEIITIAKLEAHPEVINLGIAQELFTFELRIRTHGRLRDSSGNERQFDSNFDTEFLKALDRTTVQVSPSAVANFNIACLYEDSPSNYVRLNEMIPDIDTKLSSNCEYIDLPLILKSIELVRESRMKDHADVRVTCFVGDEQWRTLVPPL